MGVVLSSGLVCVFLPLPLSPIVPATNTDGSFSISLTLRKVSREGTLSYWYSLFSGEKTNTCMRFKGKTDKFSWSQSLDFMNVYIPIDEGKTIMSWCHLRSCVLKGRWEEEEEEERAGWLAEGVTNMGGFARMYVTKRCQKTLSGHNLVEGKDFKSTA